MSQRQFRSDDTSTWTDAFGSGSDGAYSPSTGTDAPIDSACTGTAAATSLTATNASFTSGQLILIHQSIGTGVGAWELNKISSYVAGTITLSYPLINTYASGAQVLVLKQYSSATIAGGVTLTAKAWNGTVGGIVSWLCTGTTSVAGSIVGSGKGYRGGASALNQGTQGEGTIGIGSVGTAANGNAGGGGLAATNWGGGGGGGHAASGSDTTVAADRGFGGGTSGVAALTTMTFGGAGGGAAWQNSSGATGGTGGAIVMIFSPTITVTGTLPNNGSAGTAAGASSSGGGGGAAGGSTLLKGQVVTLGSSLLSATAGSGGAASGSGDTGGAGALGRIHVDYLTSVSGSASPTIDTRQDLSLLIPSTGAFFLMF